jgi:DNA helicase HerA-like ATPase
MAGICLLIYKQTGGGAMLQEGKIWVANNESGEKIYLLPRMANRHGLIAGATGTGKTVTARVLAEAFSDMGVPVFMADVKGDLAGIMSAGTDSPDMQERISRFGLADAGFSYQGYPVNLWDIYGKNGIPLRTTISEMGPILMSRILQLNDLQSDILSIVFRIADDEGLLLVDIKDLKSMLNYVQAHAKDYAEQYGRMSSASIGAILRALVALEGEGGDLFFGETALNISDWMSTFDGKGIINILDSQILFSNGRLYATFLLWLLSELFETMPEVGDLDKPKMVFFFDEAHLLFRDANKALLEKIEQVVKLIRSKGVGVYFCTQNPRDIPDGVLAQLGNRVQHALRAYTPADQKAVRAAAQSFRENPAFNSYETLQALGTGEALISFLGEDGIPMVVQKAYVLPPKSIMGAISDAQRDQNIKGNVLYSKYANYHDPDSAYEFLERLGLEEAAAAEKAKEEAARAKEEEKARREEEREAAREAQKAENAKKRAAKSVGNSVAGTVGREAGKILGGNFGKFGKTVGGNLGASLGRGIFGTLFKN